MNQKDEKESQIMGIDQVLTQRFSNRSLWMTGWLVLSLALIFLLSTAAQAANGPASFADIADDASPAVVNISTVKEAGQRFGGFGGQPPFGQDERMREFFEKFFGGPGSPMPRPKQQALGTGFIIDPAGYIVTNNHVVEGADEVMVRLSDERELEAKIVGRDPKTDLALIRIEAGVDLPSLKLGDPDQTRIGDWVMAIGNPFGLKHTVTAGILSARGRVIGAGPYDDFLQTDASINPGNSGGPLLNMDGDVIGINTAIVAHGQGIGFAIPADLAQGVIQQLKTHGKVVRGWLGVMIQEVTPELAESFGLEEAEGALVADVFDDSPAEKAGLKRGDVIVRFNGETVESSADLPAIVAAVQPGQKAKVEVVRNGKQKTFRVDIGEMDQEQAAMAGPTQAEGLGIQVQELTPELAERLGLAEAEGVVIAGIRDGSPAADSGLKPGDLIVEVNHQEIENTADYRKALEDVKQGDSVLFLVKRQQHTLFYTVEAE
jgi:serine protease Do